MSESLLFTKQKQTLHLSSINMRQVDQGDYTDYVWEPKIALPDTNVSYYYCEVFEFTINSHSLDSANISKYISLEVESPLVKGLYGPNSKKILATISSHENMCSLINGIGSCFIMQNPNHHQLTFRLLAADMTPVPDAHVNFAFVTAFTVGIHITPYE